MSPPSPPPIHANNLGDFSYQPHSPPLVPHTPQDQTRSPATPATTRSSGESTPLAPPPKIDTRVPIFRVTGIPLSATQEDLAGVLMCEFDTGEDILPVASGLVGCASCYDGRTQTALLEFAPGKAPSVLRDFLDDGANKAYMISFPSGGDIAIDQDFQGLTQLYPTHHPIKADIVAVCGLDQHAYGSWSGKADNRGIKRMWLRDFLQEDLPSCRTMIYGYHSRLRGARGLRELPDYADVFLEELRKARRTPEEKDRPIIFIGHGFGGILIAEAIIKAKANIDKYGALFESTKATIFYAIPDRAQVVDDILSIIGDDSARGDLVKSLRRGSEGELHNFINCASPYGLKIINYEEGDQTTRLMKGENVEWAREGDLLNAVGEAPAILHLPDSIEDTLIIDGDRSTLVKFQYKAQPSYSSVLMHLEECTNDTGLLGRHMTAETAIKNGTYHDLARVLETGTVDINAPLKHLQGSPTLLHIAASANDTRKVDLLLEQGANIESRDVYGSTALHQAIASKNVKMVKLLLQNGGNNQRQGLSPGINWMYELPLLHFACAEGNCEIVEALAKTGDASLEDCAGPNKYHPIHFAAINNDSSVLEMLVIEKKVDTKAQDELEQTALHLAVANELDRNTRLLLLHGADIEARDLWDVTPLQLAVQSENEGIVDILLDSGADIAAYSPDDGTLLHIACKRSNEKIVKKLLDRETDIERKGAYIERKCLNDMTPLLCAAEGGSKSIFELLVSSKADVTAVDYQRHTLLHKAAGNMDGSLVELILSHGVDIEARDSDGRTPLHIAAQVNDGPMAQSLLKNGASTASKDEEGATPLHTAAGVNSYEVVKQLLDHKADIQTGDPHGETPLHLAASGGNERLIKLLLEHQAGRKARDSELRRPIEIAWREGHMGCVRLLKERS